MNSTNNKNIDYINLISKSAQIIEQAQKEHKELLEFKSLFFGLSTTDKNFSWWKCWDCESKQHVYKWGNKKFFDVFFGLNELEFEEQLNYVQGKTDLFLLAKYRHDKNIKHTYGDLCVSTDIHCMNIAIEEVKQGRRPFACNYIELGIIGNQPLILDVRKVPLFYNEKCHCIPPCKEPHNYCGSRGTAMNKTEFFSQIDLDDLVRQGKLKKLSDCVYWLIPDQKFDWEVLRKENIL